MKSLSINANCNITSLHNYCLGRNHIKGAFESGFQPVFRQNLNLFFFLLQNNFFFVFLDCFDIL